MKRDFLDLVGRPQRLLRRLRSLAFGSAIAALGLSATQSVLGAEPGGATPTEPVLSATIVDRSKKAAKLILRLRGHIGTAFASHSSHRSHSSHSSHSSHYSGTSGTVRSPRTPSAPVTTPAPSPTPLATLPSNDTITGKFQSFDRARRTLKIHDAIGTPFEFSWRDDTLVAGGQRLDEYLESHPGHPWTVGQSLSVTWKPSADGKKRVLVSVR